MRNKPKIWLDRQGTVPTRLYGTIIRLAPTEPLGREPGDIILLTRDRLPQFPSFPVYLDNDVETTVRCSTVNGHMEVDDSTLGMLTDFTLAVFHDIFKKTYSRVTEDFPYWLAPSQEIMLKAEPRRSTGLFGMIDWDAVRYIQGNPVITWSRDMRPESLVDRFMYDDWNGKYRYLSIAIARHLRPSDPPPYYVPSRKWNTDILNWSLSLSKNSRVKFFDRCDWSQPVVHVELMSPRRNFLDKATEEEISENIRCVICPQALNISPVSSNFQFGSVVSPLMRDRFLCQ